MVRELMDAGPAITDGHEEIELALVRLFRATGNESYVGLAERLVERRGRIKGFARLILQQNRSSGERSKRVKEMRQRYVEAHPNHTVCQLPPANVAKKSRGGHQRFLLNAPSGKMLQQHRHVRQQTVPVGHAVRFAYLETAIAMLYREKGDAKLLVASEKAGDRMVQRRMYVSGGVGSLPEIEGFGRDYELDPELAYAETCAAPGRLFWNWEMVLATRQARYSDLFEWQLYNAASVGMGLDGTSYLYNNPLLCRGGITRREWFQVPAALPTCPSHGRRWASICYPIKPTRCGSISTWAARQPWTWGFRCGSPWNRGCPGKERYASGWSQKCPPSSRSMCASPVGPGPSG